MDKFVKEISTNKYKCISQADFDADPSLYIDRSDRPHYILNHYKETGRSYWQVRYKVKELVDNSAGGFNDFNSVDKDALCLFSYGDRNAIVTHYATTMGLSVDDAKGLMVLREAENIAKLSLDAKVIAASPKMMVIGVKYLTLVDIDGNVDSTQAYSLTEAINDFKKQYEDYGVLGLEYGDEHEGIMDYFESTNSYSSGGLKNYTFNPDVVAAAGSEENARLAMVAELQELFVKGNI